MLWKLIERRGLYGENSLVMDKFLLVEEKIFKLLEGAIPALKFLCIDNIL
ncbi:hypothetical protein [Tepidanaerobacter syntrophicus]|nr:hypothetical protein [Tepidanaerobacter syntrophicus]